jgi:alkylation response protein AidB-like acyl-CoA dehydrogenase
MATTGPRERLTTVSDLPDRARALVPLVDEHASLGEEKGELTDDVLDALHREGLFAMWTPRPLDGAELAPVPSLEALEHISYADPSAGWLLMAGALETGTAGAYLADDAVAEIFAGERLPIVAGQGTRPGTAIPKDGGFDLSGAWSFASGIRHAGYTHSLAAIEGTDELRIFVVPVEKATLVENWDVLGLRATASIDYTMDSVFVPEGFSHPATTETPRRGGNLFALGIIGFVSMGHTGWALGAGRRMLDELAALARSKAGRPGALAESDSFQEKFANAELKLRAARALVFETWGDVQETLDRGDRLSVRQHTLIRGALTNSTWSVQEIATFVYLAAGTTALRDGALQRLFRDVHAGTQHITSSPPVIHAVGRELGGLAEGQKWQFIQLVDA